MLVLRLRRKGSMTRLNLLWARVAHGTSTEVFHHISVLDRALWLRLWQGARRHIHLMVHIGRSNRDAR